MAGLAAPLIGAGMGLIGMVGQNARARKQHGRTKELMDIQNKNQHGLNKQGADLQMDMWNKTNYGAQMKHLKDAGLNASLMYGNSGGGGTTAGSQTGGNAGLGQAHAPMDIGNALQAGMMSAEIALKKSQARNLDSDTENKGDGGIVRSEANTRIAKLIEETGTEIEKQGLVKAQKIVADMQAKNVEKDTERIGKTIEVAEQERLLKKYEVGLNKLGIQKTDNKVFRYLTNMASENGYTLQGIIESIINATKKKPIVPLGKVEQ